LRPARDLQSLSEHLRSVLPLSREHGLSAYDAAYLELAARHGASLATLGRKLRKAAETAEVRIFGKPG
jgi:predicted nucleic acid-binding protein